METGEKYSLKIEADEVIKEIKFAVKHVEVSSALKSTEELVYFNLEIKENKKFCVELSPRGFRMIGDDFDRVDRQEGGTFYETIYAMLDSISPGYRNTFGDTLAQKLMGIQQQTETPEDDT